MDTEVINKQQSLFVSNATGSSHQILCIDRNTKFRKVLDRFCTLDDDKLSFAANEDFLGIKKFLNTIDLDHPELSRVFKVSIDLLDFVCDAIDVLTYIESTSNNNLLIEQVRRSIVQHPAYNNFKGFDSPVKTLNYVRFLPDEFKEEARSQKKPQEVGLYLFCGRGESHFLQQPDDLVCFSRYENCHKKDIEIAQRRKKHFEYYGMPSMAGVIQETIDELKAKKEQNFFGFQKVSASDVSVVLAKMMNASFKENEERNYIYLPKNQQAGWFPEVESRYRPFLYPWHMMKDLASKEIKEMISSLDCFVDVSEKAAFDHYWVLLPDFRQSNDSGLDKIPDSFVRSGKGVGALLGDKDGDLYFICYWTQSCYENTRE